MKDKEFIDTNILVYAKLDVKKIDGKEKKPLLSFNKLEDVRLLAYRF